MCKNAEHRAASGLSKRLALCSLMLAAGAAVAWVVGMSLLGEAAPATCGAVIPRAQGVGVALAAAALVPRGRAWMLSAAALMVNVLMIVAAVVVM